MLDLLASFGWYHAAILVEEASNVPFYKNIGPLLLDYSKRSSLPFAMELYILNSDAAETVRKSVYLAKQKSRGAVCITSYEILEMLSSGVSICCWSCRNFSISKWFPFCSFHFSHDWTNCCDYSRACTVARIWSRFNAISFLLIDERIIPRYKTISF